MLPGPPADLLDPGQPLAPTGSPTSATFAATNRIELVPTPTYASYLNPVEMPLLARSHEFVVTNADYLDWDAFAYALARHITYRNGDHRDRRIAAAEANTASPPDAIYTSNPTLKAH